MPSEDDIRHTPPQGGEPERRRDERRTRRQAGATGNRTLATPRAPNPSEPMIHVPGTFCWHRSRGPRDAPHTVAPLLVHPGARESSALWST
jgi:hypothetical protein